MIFIKRLNMTEAKIPNGIILNNFYAKDNFYPSRFVNNHFEDCELIVENK